MTVWKDNVDAFIARRDETGVQVDAIRKAAITEALEHLVAGRPGRAEYVMARALMAQARAVGIGVLQLGPQVDVAWPPLTVVHGEQS